MSATTPSFTDYVSVVSAQVLARGSTARGTIDLTAKFGGFLYASIGRGGTTALTNGVGVEVRRYYNDGTNDIPHPNSALSRLSSTTAASSTTCATSNSTAGSPTLNVASITGFAAGDLVCIQDSGGGVTRLEFQKVSKTAAGILTLDGNLVYTHTSAGADTVRNKSDVFAPIWLAGGAKYEVIFDYGDDSAGESVTVWGRVQRYDNDTTA